MHPRWHYILTLMILLTTAALVTLTLFKGNMDVLSYDLALTFLSLVLALLAVTVPLGLVRARYKLDPNGGLTDNLKLIPHTGHRNVYIAVNYAQLALGIGIAGLIVAGLVLGVQKYGAAFFTIEPRDLLVMGLALAIGLFWARCRMPLAYGIAELCVGFVSVYLSVNAGKGPQALLASGGDPIYGLATRAIGILGGIYILVRGMDNVDKGLPSSWWSRRVWDRFFHGTIRDT